MWTWDTTEKMKMRAIEETCTASRSICGRIAVDKCSQKNHIWLNDRNNVYVNKTINAKPKFFTLLIERSKDHLVAGIPSSSPTLLEHLERGQGKPLTLSGVNARGRRRPHSISSVARN